MDVLIKGLPLPQEGEYDYHLTIRSDGKVEGTQQVGERIHSIHTWAIELPEHGDLIPYHAVRKAIINFLCKDNPEWCDLMDEIDKIDVVVEGSRGSDN